MSRRDIYHNTVKQALIQEGWTITHDPYMFQSEPELSTDIGAEKIIAVEKQHEKILVEIKSFLNVSQVTDLEKAMGQYILYRRLLKKQEPERKLYLAVPTHAFEGIFSQQVGLIAIEELDMTLIVFSVSGEEKLLWKIP